MIRNSTSIAFVLYGAYTETNHQKCDFRNQKASKRVNSSKISASRILSENTNISHTDFTNDDVSIKRWKMETLEKFKGSTFL